MFLLKQKHCCSSDGCSIQNVLISHHHYYLNLFSVVNDQFPLESITMYWHIKLMKFDPEEAWCSFLQPRFRQPRFESHGLKWLYKLTILGPINHILESQLTRCLWRRHIHVCVKPVNTAI